jgi:dipeptidyl aminopeptidase/acylaminoacyl peptidase
MAWRLPRKLSAALKFRWYGMTTKLNDILKTKDGSLHYLIESLGDMGERKDRTRRLRSGSVREVLPFRLCVLVTATLTDAGKRLIWHYRERIVRSWYWVLAITAVLMFPIRAWPQSFTLEQVMSSPFPTELAASRETDRVAWVFDVKGVRNVWVADGPDFARTARQLTNYTGDDGQPITSLRLTFDGKSVVYARGSELNEQGQSADPDHDVHQPAQQVWAKDVDSSEPPRVLGELGCSGEDCEDVKVSPDGKWALWAAKTKLWLASVDGKEQAKSLAYIRGNAREPQWSPDSKGVAFVSDRGDHALIGLYNLDGKSVRYLAPSVDKDDLPRWSEDGKWIGYVRTRGTEQKMPLIPVHAEPWEIWIADTTTGQARELWHSGDDQRDSIPERTEHTAFHFANDRIVFVSEQDGHNHLYSIRSTGGAPVLLTGGEFDVEDVLLSADQKSVIYTSNQDDADRRHIWVVPVVGGEPQRALTHGNTIEWSPVETGRGNNLVCLGSSATSPAMPYVVTAGGREMLAAQALPSSFPSEHLVVPEPVIFKSEDGLLLHGQLFAPKNAKDKERPGLLFIHGGPSRQMVLGFHYRYSYHSAYAMNQYLASCGYVVLSINYRLGSMYGRDFREPPNTMWRGASEYKDIVAAGKYLQSLPQVDPHRIGLWGGSYGGFLTAMGLAKNSDIFKAGVDLYGVHDWSLFLAKLPHFDNPARRAPDADLAIKLAWESSPDAYTTTWRSPVLLIQGDDDRNVPFEQTVDLAQRLRAQHIPFEQLIIPDEVHAFLMWSTHIRVYSATRNFFDRMLNNGDQVAGN